MDCVYAKVVVKGSPISKSNFKLFNINGRAILPRSSGKYHDRYALYEEEIAFEARIQNPGLVIEESLIAVLKVYYKSQKRHPDTTNITKSIFDGIEKSGLIVNDAQIRNLIIEEFYDIANPRFELELFGESNYQMNVEITKKCDCSDKIIYKDPPNKKKGPSYCKRETNENKLNCSICGKLIKDGDYVTANGGTLLLCKACLKNLF